MIDYDPQPELNMQEEDRALTNTGDECVRCATSKFSSSKPGWIYLEKNMGLMVLERKWDTTDYKRYNYSLRCDRCGYQPTPTAPSSQQAMAMYRTWKALNK